MQRNVKHLINISTGLGITVHFLDPRIFPGAVRIKATLLSKGLQNTRSINALSSVIFIFYFKVLSFNFHLLEMQMIMNFRWLCAHNSKSSITTTNLKLIIAVQHRFAHLGKKYICCFLSGSRLFYSCSNIIFVYGGLQNLGLLSALTLLWTRKERSLSCHTYYVTGPRFTCSRQKDWPITCTLPFFNKTILVYKCIRVTTDYTQNRKQRTSKRCLHSDIIGIVIYVVDRGKHF